MKQNEINLVNQTIERLDINSIAFKFTLVEMIRIMQESRDCEEYLDFYSKIGFALIDQEQVSDEEKKHFLIIHKSIVDIYNKI